MAHGSSPAAWASITLALVGFTVGAISLIPSPNWTIFTIGVVLTFASLPLAAILAKMGLGEKESSH